LLLTTDKTVGLWTAPGAATGATGTYAIIIGVSAYTGPTIPQLYTSAYTAARLFTWLCARERYGAAPLRSCRLLLAPTELERAAIAADFGLPATAYANADFTTCDAALRAWYRDLAGVPDSSQESRSLFYFCGHGVEFATNRQILLPSDYLEDGHTGASRAMSSSNLMDGLGDVSVGLQVFYFDACRNDGPLRDIVPPDGAVILDLPRRTKPRRLVGLSASLSGGTTTQTTSIADGGSFFGLALHEALNATPQPRPFPQLPDASVNPNVVRFGAMMQYLNARMDALYQKSLDPVGFIGPVSALDTVAAELPTVASPPAPTPFRPDSLLSARGGTSFVESFAGAKGIVPWSMSAAKFPLNASSYGALHKIVGHEWITHPLIDVKLWVSDDGSSWTPAGSLESHEAGVKGLTARLTFAVPSEAADRFLWVTWSGTFAFLIPPMPAGTLYTLQAAWDAPGVFAPGTALLAPALRNSSEAQGAANLWNEYITLAEPNTVLANGVVKRLAKTHHAADILAAEIVQLHLVRAGNEPTALDVDDLMLAAASRTSDAAVFGLVRRLQRSDELVWSEIVTLLQAVSEKGPPALAPSYGHLLTALDHLAFIVPRTLEPAPADAETLRAVRTASGLRADVKRKLANAFGALRATHGLFARFASPTPLDQTEGSGPRATNSFA
jgi:hypothetical protein